MLPFYDYVASIDRRRSTAARTYIIHESRNKVWLKPWSRVVYLKSNVLVPTRLTTQDSRLSRTRSLVREMVRAGAERFENRSYHSPLRVIVLVVAVVAGDGAILIEDVRD